MAALLKSLAKSKGRSIRSIEKQMGVGTSIFYKVLKGEVTLHVRHLLMIADALDIPWAEFFHLAYPRQRPMADTAAAIEEVDEAFDEGHDDVSPEFEERVKRILHELGLLEEADDRFRKRSHR